MPGAKYWSKRISGSVLPYLPRLSLSSVLPRKKAAHHPPTIGVVSDTSRGATSTSYPHLIAQKSAKIRAYIHQIAHPLFRRFKPQNERSSTRSEHSRDDMDLDETAHICPVPQPPYPPFSATTETSPPASPISDSTAVFSLEETRKIRAEQDAALEQARKADQELIERLLEARRQAAEHAKLLAEEEERRRIQEEMEMIRRRTQNHWRRWARRALIPSDPSEGGIKIAVRLPSGRRRVGILPADASLEILHTLVETYLIPPEHPPEDDPEQPPEGYTHCWEFSLVTTHERVVLPKDSESQIGGLDVLKQGVLLIMEEHPRRELVEDDTEME